MLGSQTPSHARPSGCQSVTIPWRFGSLPGWKLTMKMGAARRLRSTIILSGCFCTSSEWEQAHLDSNNHACLYRVKA
jgi:hypothetical protein